MVDNIIELNTGKWSLILMGIGIYLCCKTIYQNDVHNNMKTKITKITKIDDIVPDDWWPYVDYNKVDTEDNMYNIWSRP